MLTVLVILLVVIVGGAILGGLLTFLPSAAYSKMERGARRKSGSKPAAPETS